MKTTTVALSLPQLRSRSCLTERLADFVSLMKPRVMLLAVFTAVVGLAIAPGHLDLLSSSLAILAIAAGAGAAGVLNMWYDADIDGMMARTAERPIPRGNVARGEALAFGLVLAGGAVAVLAVAVNVTSAALLAFAIFFYGVIAVTGGALFVGLALRLRRAGAFYQRAAHLLFGFSIIYLTVLFAALLADSGGKASAIVFAWTSSIVSAVGA